MRKSFKCCKLICNLTFCTQWRAFRLQAADEADGELTRPVVCSGISWSKSLGMIRLALSIEISVDVLELHAQPAGFDRYELGGALVVDVGCLIRWCCWRTQSSTLCVSFRMRRKQNDMFYIDKLG